MTRSFDIRWARRRVSGAFWVTFDQGVFALANFTISILFARWLSPVNYGWFAMSFSGCLLVMTLHSGAILEPMLVQSAQVAPNRRRSYVVSLVHAHLIFLAIGVMLAMLSFVAGAIGNNIQLGWVIATSLVGGTAMATLSTARRLCGIFVSPRVSAFVGLLYLAGTVLTGILLHAAVTVVWLEIWLIVSTWSLIGSAATFWIAYRRATGNDIYCLAELISFAGRFAHWGLATSLVGWLRSDGLFLILARVGGLSAVAETRAIFNIGAPLVQANMAAHISAIVWFSSDQSNAGKPVLWRLIGVYAGGSLIVVLLVHASAGFIVRLLYGGRYLSASWQLSIYYLALAMYGLDVIVSSASKSQGLMLRGYGSGLLAGAISVVLGLLLIPLQQTLVYVLVISSAIGLAAAVTFRMSHIDGRVQ